MFQTRRNLTGAASRVVKTANKPAFREPTAASSGKRRDHQGFPVHAVKAYAEIILWTLICSPFNGLTQPVARESSLYSAVVKASDRFFRTLKCHIDTFRQYHPQLFHFVDRGFRSVTAQLYVCTSGDGNYYY